MSIIKHEDWELIDDSGSLFRLAIPGGWLVKTMEDVYHDRFHDGRGMEGGWDWRPGLTFVPDPDHEWVIV